MHKVLIVEDDYLQSYVLKAQLQGMGYEVTGSTNTGEEAVRLAIETKPDIILMDITLDGDMDGIEAAKKIEQLIDTYLIYITGNTDDLHRTRALDTNYTHYLEKPISKSILNGALSGFQKNV